MSAAAIVLLLPGLTVTEFQSEHEVQERRQAAMLRREISRLEREVQLAHSDAVAAKKETADCEKQLYSEMREHHAESSKLRLTTLKPSKSATVEISTAMAAGQGAVSTSLALGCKDLVALAHPHGLRLPLTDSQELGELLFPRGLCVAVVHSPEPGYVEASRCFDEVVSTLLTKAEELGARAEEVCVIRPGMEWHDICNTSQNVSKVLVGYHLLFSLSAYSFVSNIPKDFILYNMEQVGRPKWFNNSRMITALKSHRVWDYSPRNRMLLRRLSIDAAFMPVVYTEGLTRPELTAPSVQDIDVLLVGECNPKRCNLIRELNDLGFKAHIAGYNGPGCRPCASNMLPPVYGRKRDALLRRAKIHLNVHYMPEAIFEVVRVSYYLANKQFVISESGKDKALEQRFAGGVVFVRTVKEIPKLCKYYLHNKPARVAIAAKGFEVMKAQRLGELRCELFREHSTTRRMSVSVGRTMSHTTQLVKAFINEGKFVPHRSFSVIAVVAGFNEADALYSAIVGYLSQGCSVHYIDNWSTDSTQLILDNIQEQLQKGCLLNPHNVTLTYETFPTEPTNRFDWGDILRRKAEIASGMPHDWVVHGDADELRESPWGREVSLRQALYVAQATGHNCVNFGRVLNFHPTKHWECPSKGPCDLSRFEHFEYNTYKGNSRQEKAWMNRPTPSLKLSSGGRISTPWNLVDLSSSGGHTLRFKSSAIAKRLFPWDFILRHYPIRSQEHGLRKVFKERKPRWNKEERNNPEKEWHAQYDNIQSANHSFSRDSEELKQLSSSASEIYARDLPCL